MRSTMTTRRSRRANLPSARAAAAPATSSGIEENNARSGARRGRTLGPIALGRLLQRSLVLALLRPRAVASLAPANIAAAPRIGMIGGTNAREPAAVVERFSPKALSRFERSPTALPIETRDGGQQKVN